MDLTNKIKISDDSSKNIYKDYFENFKITMECVISGSADNSIFPLITNVINVLLSIKLSIIYCVCDTCCSLHWCDVSSYQRVGLIPGLQRISCRRCLNDGVVERKSADIEEKIIHTFLTLLAKK